MSYVPCLSSCCLYMSMSRCREAAEARRMQLDSVGMVAKAMQLMTVNLRGTHNVEERQQIMMEAQRLKRRARDLNNASQYLRAEIAYLGPADVRSPVSPGASSPGCCCLGPRRRAMGPCRLRPRRPGQWGRVVACGLVARAMGPCCCLGPRRPGHGAVLRHRIDGVASKVRKLAVRSMLRPQAETLRSPSSWAHTVTHLYTHARAHVHAGRWMSWTHVETHVYARV